MDTTRIAREIYPPLLERFEPEIRKILPIVYRVQVTHDVESENAMMHVRFRYPETGREHDMAGPLKFSALACTADAEAAVRQWFEHRLPEIRSRAISDNGYRNPMAD